LQLKRLPHSNEGDIASKLYVDNTYKTMDGIKVSKEFFLTDPDDPESKQWKVLSDVNFTRDDKINLDKAVTDASRAAEAKVDKAEGMGLSHNDFDDKLFDKLAMLPEVDTSSSFAGRNLKEVLDGDGGTGDELGKVDNLDDDDKKVPAGRQGYKESGQGLSAFDFNEVRKGMLEEVFTFFSGLPKQAGNYKLTVSVVAGNPVYTWNQA